MRLLKNRIVIGILCIAVALLIGFVAVPALSGSQSKISVVRMTGSITAGTQITEEMVETVSVPDGIVSGCISNASSVVGKYANSDLYNGDYLTAEKITDTLEKADSFSAGTRKGKMVVSITLQSLASGVSGRLLPGDVVTVMAIPKSETIQTLGVEPTEATDEVTYNSAPSTVIYSELQYVEVCMVTTSQGADAMVEADPVEDQANTLPVTVSFYVNQQQALRLAELEREGTIYLAYVARGADVAQYIPDEDRVMNTEVD